MVKVLDLSRANASHFESISSYWRCTVEGNNYLKESTNISENIFESEEESDAALLEELRAAHLHHCEIHLAKHSKSEEVSSKPETVCADIKIENKQASATPMTTLNTQEDSTHNSDDSDCGMQSSSSCAGMQTLLLEADQELLHRQDN